MRWVALLVVVLGVAWLLQTTRDSTPLNPTAPRNAAEESPVVLQGREAVNEANAKAVPAIEDFPAPPLTDRTVIVHGRVVLPNGDPAEGVKLHTRGSGRLDRMVTRADGRFRVRVKPGAKGQVNATPPAPYLLTHGRLPAPDGELEIVLERGASLDVQVLGQGERPVANARVIAYALFYRLVGKTDVQGRVVLDGIPRGSEFSVAVDGRGATPPHPHATKRFVDQWHVVVRLPDPTYLEGRVLTPEGQPVATQVVAMSVGEPQHGAAAEAVAGTGRFRLGPVPAGAYRVYVDARAPFADSATARVASPAVGIELVVQRPTSLRRSVRLPKGGSVDFATWCFSDRSYLMAVEEHRPDGPWHVGAVVPDAQGVLYLRDVDGRFALFQDVRPADVPGEIVPRTGGTISGTIEVDASPDIAFRMGALVIPGEIEDGTFEITGVPQRAQGVIQVTERERVVHEVDAHEGKRDVRIKLTLHPDDE